MSLFQEPFTELSRGMKIGEIMLFAKSMRRGRLSEEREVDVWYKGGQGEGHLTYIGTFEGRKPSYAPWVEFFGIEPTAVGYFDSPLERALIHIFSEALPPGGRIFVEYLEDEETMVQLSRGYPAPTSRLGYLLFQNGFTWFKDWYFPEGLREGNVKLQGEKPLNEGERAKHLRMMYEDLGSFLLRVEGKDEYGRRAIKRAHILMEVARGLI